MPIFEYTCNVCQTGRKFSALVGVVADAPAPTCPRCGSTDVKKAVSRFARLRSEDEVTDEIADRADRTDFDDTRAVRRLMRDMAGGMGEDFDAGDFDEIMDGAESEAAHDGGRPNESDG